MSKQRDCEHCGSSFIVKRNPKQHYCSESDCQRARKNHWRCDTRRNDADYISNQNRANQRWQASHPDYWKQYRASHPEYVQRNREQQRVRDGTVTDHVPDLANGDASHLAKSDALRVEISVITTRYPVIDESCKETTL